MKLKWIFILFFTAFITMTSYAAETVNFGWKLTLQKTLTIQIPSCWDKSIQPPEDADNNQYGEMVFTDQCESNPTGELVRISATNLSTSLAASSGLRNFVEAAGKLLLDRSVETKLSIQSLKGADVEGYYYTLTDKAPKSDEYLYITQGGINLKKDILLFFTYLHHENTPAEMKTFLSALESIKLVGTPLQAPTEGRTKVQKRDAAIQDDVSN